MARRPGSRRQPRPSWPRSRRSIRSACATSSSTERRGCRCVHATEDRRDVRYGRARSAVIRARLAKDQRESRHRIAAFAAIGSTLEAVRIAASGRVGRRPLLGGEIVAALIGVLIVLAVLFLFVLLPSLRISQEWERKVVLRLGRFAGVRGPGVFILVPY